MGYFKNIYFDNYRNFEKLSLNFGNNSNVLFGINGSGKTNILEGISLFDKGRGFRKDKIINLINFNNNLKNFNIKSNFQNQDLEFNINIFNSEKNLKKLLINDSNDRDSAKHFESIFSIIYFLPEMERLFLASPSFRRNFLDRLIFNFDKKYNLIVNNYKKSIYERQLLLKNSKYDEAWADELEKNIVQFGSVIYNKRVKHIDILNKTLQKLNLIKDFSHHFFLKIDDNLLSDHNDIQNNNHLYITLLKQSRKKDLFTGGCSIGPHRSDLLGFSLDNQMSINQFSTGQQKTAILLIIIAQCKYLKEALNLNPIILLDEACSHLDDFNKELLLYLIDELEAQIFMTGTEKKFFSFLSTKAKYYNIT